MKNKRIISIVLVMLFAVSMFSTMTFAEGEIVVNASISGSTVTISGTSISPKVVVRVYYDKDKDGIVSQDGKIDPVVVWPNVTMSVADNGYAYTCDKFSFGSESETGTYIALVTDTSGNAAQASFNYSRSTNGGINGGTVTPSSPKPSPSGSPEPTTEPTTQPTIGPDEYPFTDVTDAYDWAKGAIRVLASKGIVNGIGNDLFAPDNNVTRAEFVKMIVGFFDDAGSSSMTFNDVDANAWYYQYVMKAAALGITNGDDMGNFNPDASITREDMCVMLARAGSQLGLVVPDVALTFADADQVSDYAKAAVAGFAQLRIVEGKGDNIFDPKASATRAEAAKVIYEVFVVNLKK